MARTKEFDADAVLDKAMQLFWCKGYHDTSMQDLVEGLGISRSSLYDTFGDKHQLFIAALERYRGLQAAAMIRLVEDAPAVLPAIRSLFAHMAAETAADKLQKGCFMVNSTVEVASSNPEVAAIVGANRRAIEEALCRVIERGQQTGEITGRHPPRSLARFLFNAFSGLRVAARSGGDPQAFDDIVAVTLSVLQ